MLKFLPRLQVILLIALLASLFSQAQVKTASQDDALFRIYRNGKYGYIDKSGNILVPPQFDEAQEHVDEGIALVGINKKYGFIDRKGQYIVPTMFDAAKPFSEGLAAIKSGLMWGFIDKNGNVVIKPIYLEVEDFSEGLAKVGRLQGDIYKGGFWEFGYIDKTGKEIIPFGFYAGTSFHRGVALAFEPEFNTNVYINPRGQIIARREEISFNPSVYLHPNANANIRYPAIRELICESNPSGAMVFLIPKFDWEGDPNFIFDDEKLKKYKIPTGNTPTKVMVKEKKFIALFIRYGERKWVEVDVPINTLAKVEF